MSAQLRTLHPQATVKPTPIGGAEGDLSVRQTLAGRHLLMTGVTGFVGKVWLAMLLEEVPRIGRVTILTRGLKGQSARQRIEAMLECSPAFRPLRERFGASIMQLLGGKLQVVEGNVAKPGCDVDSLVSGEDVGSSDAVLPCDLRTVAARIERARAVAAISTVDVVVHFAGLTDFEPDPLQALDVNVRGALHAAELMERSVGKRLLYVSTTFVAGNVSGRIAEGIVVGVSPAGVSFDPEDELLLLERLCAEPASRGDRIVRVNERAAQLGWPNIYTYTKGLAEHLLLLRHPGQVTVVRPSIVESALRYPFPGWTEGVNTSAPLVWLLSSAFRRFPSRPGHLFDVIPVDHVARGIMLVLAAVLRGESQIVYHLSSGDSNPLTFGRAVELTALAVRQIHSGPNASWWERHVLRHLDAVPVGGDRPVPLGVTAQKRVVQRLRTTLRSVELRSHLPRFAYRRLGGAIVEARLRDWAVELRQFERKLQRIEDLLRLYKPFIYDNNYLFEADGVRRLGALLADDERQAFGIDVKAIDWYRYWLEVQVPGLEKWSLPQLRGERVAQDPPQNWRTDLSADARPGAESNSSALSAEVAKLDGSLGSTSPTRGAFAEVASSASTTSGAAAALKSSWWVEAV